MAGTNLAAGDVAVVGLNTGQSDSSGNPATVDTIYFVVLQAIAAGTVIYFTDRSWNGTAFGAAGGGEGTFTYTAPGGGIAAGTVITITSAQLSAAGMTLSNTGDNLYVFQGTDANTPTTFLYAVDFADGNTVFNASLTNTGLTNGVNALAVDLDSGAYSGPTTQADSYLKNGTNLVTAISDPNNWYGDNRDSVNALVQPSQQHFLVSPDIQIWGAAAGGGDGIIRIDADATGGGLGVELNQVRIYTSDGDEGAAFQNLFVAPRDIVIDTVHGKFFVADSDLAGTNRILQGNLSDLLGSPGTVPTVTVLYTDATSGVNSQIRNLVLDPEHGYVYFSHAVNNAVQRVNYDTAGQTPSTIVNLGTSSGNPNGTTNNFVDDFVYDPVHDTIYITSHRVTAAADGDVISRNYIYKVTGVSGFSGTTFTFTGGNVTVLPFNPDDAASGVLFTPGEAFPREFGSLEGIAISPDGNTIYFATGTILEDTDGDGGTGGGSGTAPVIRYGGIFSYSLTGNAAGNFTVIYQQNGSTGPLGLLDELEIDFTSGRYYVADTTGGTAQPGDEGIWTGLLSGGTPVRLSTVANINGLLLDGFQINRAPTLTVTNSAGTYTETAGASSGFGTGVALISGSIAGDTDTTNLSAQLAGAVVRISSGFLSGAGHQDQLTINGTTSGTTNGVTYSYDSTTGVMTLTGQTTFANYQTVLNLVRYNVSGDNPTAYGTDTTRTFSWSVSDGLVSSDEQSSTVTVTGVNDAPINTTGGTATGAEDAASIAITGISVSDADADPASQNVTVTLSVAHGTLDIATNVSGGVTAGQVSGDTTGTITITATQNQINATLAAGSGLLYTPTANFNGPDAVHIVTSDGGSTGTGGTLSDTDDKAITVTAVNDAPVVAGDGTETLAATNEDVNNNALTNTVSSLFSAQFSDATDQVSGGSSADTFAGIAVTVNGSGASGNWQYWNGASWVNIGASSTASATVITAATPIRFAPAANFNGAAPTLTVKLIDSSAGALTNGSHVDVTTSGGTTAYSSGTVVLDHAVTAVNDAPTVIGGVTTTLLAVSEDTANPAGATVSSLFGSHFSDAADNVGGGSSANSFAGIMIGIDNSNAAQGHWQVFSGGSWFDLPALSPTNTYLISATDSLRFVPAANFNGTPGGIVVLLIDNSAGAVVTGTRLDSSLTGSGGSTVYSNSTMTLGTSITAVNDAPAVNADTTAAFTEGGGPIAVTPAFTTSDVDNANLTGATISISDLRVGDVLAFVNQNGITGSYNSGTGVLTLSGTASVANYQAAIRSITYDGAADANFGDTDNSRTVNITVTDGTTPSSQTATVINIANAAPTGGVANDDAVSTNENAALSGNVESNNGGGADTGVTAVTEVNGNAVSVGTQITLPSGALLTLNADGTFNYNPNGKFDYLGGPTSGASNISATDSFTYTVNGGDTATVTVTINGVDSTGDILNGNGGNNTINAGTGNDTINGLGGDDNLSGGTGNDIINGGDNNDTLNGDDGNDKLNGDNGTDTLNGGLGADLLHGGAGDDHLFGGADNDTMYGDGGNDDMHGGTGNDIYYVDDAGDTVDEAVGEGSDIVRASITWTLSANVETLQLQGVGNIDGTGNELANNLQGNDGNNTLSGLAGVDTINGGAGNDRIIGGTGNDLMTGGTGADTFVVLSESVYSSIAPAGKALEIDFVYDLNKAEGDKLDLSGVDANINLAGDQAFTLVGAFDKHAGQMTLAYTASTNLTVLSLDVDGDGKADYQMKITGDVHLDSGGWIL